MADLPAEQLTGPKGTTALQKVLDVWWRICTREGKQILKIVKADGSTDGSTTSVETEAAWNPVNQQILRDKLDTVIANQVKIINKLGA
jgi:hypothetical protein